MFPHSLFRSSQCLSLIREYELRHAMRYAWVYRTRPDVAFLDPVLMPDEMTPRTVYTNRGPASYVSHFVHWWRRTHAKAGDEDVPPLTDHFIAGLRDDMDVALQAVDSVRMCDFFNSPEERNSEAALGYWLLTHGVRVEVRPWLWVVVRAQKGPECYRVRAMRFGGLRAWLTMTNRCYAYYKQFPRHFIHDGYNGRLLKFLLSSSYLPT